MFRVEARGRGLALVFVFCPTPERLLATPFRPALLNGGPRKTFTLAGFFRAVYSNRTR